MADQPFWNPSDKDADVTLASSNRQWSQLSGTIGAVRSTVGLAAGKWYVELTHQSSGGSAARHGIATGAHTITVPPGDSVVSWVINGQATYRHNSANGTDFDNFSNGDTVNLAVDLDNGRIWFGRNNTWLSGDPSTGSSPVFTGITGTVFLAGGMDGGGSSRGGTLKELASYTGTVPTGFTAGWGPAAGGVGHEETVGGRAIVVAVGPASVLAGTGAILTAGGADLAVQPGQAALSVGDLLEAGGATVALAGGPAALLAGTGVVLAAGGTSIAVAGDPAELVAGTGLLLDAGGGRIAITGGQGQVTAGENVELTAGGARLALAAGLAALLVGQMLSAGGAALAVTGGTASLVVGTGAVLTAGGAAIAVQGGATTLQAGTGVDLAAGGASVRVTGGTAVITLGSALSAGGAALAITGGTVTLQTEQGVELTAGGARLAVTGGRTLVAAGARLRYPVPAAGDLAALLAPGAGRLEWIVIIDAWDAEAGQVVPLRWSAGDYTTGPAASLANTRLPGRLVDVQVRRALWAGTELFGRSEPARGVILLENASGELDHLATAATGSGARRWHFRRRPARILVGHPAWSFDDFVPVFTGLVEDAAFDGGRASFQLRDRLLRLDRPVQDRVFRGDRVLVVSASSVAVGVGPKTFILPNLATNGDFTSSLSGWFAGTGWTNASAKASKAAGTASALEQVMATAADNEYRLRFDVTRTAGRLQPTVAGEALGDPITAAGTWSRTFFATGSTTRVGFAADAAFAGTVDAVALRAEPNAAADDAVRIARTGDLDGTWMAGLVTSWTASLGELIVDVAEAAGAGSHSDWSIWLRPYAGTAELAGKNLPVALGTVRHAAPPEAGSVQGLWLYRLADAPVRVDPDLGHGVYDGGVALTPAESFPPAPGQAFVDGAEGALWVASRPQYPLTVTMEAGLGATAGKRVFATPGYYTFRVPAGITSLRAKLWGAGGGHGGVGAVGFPGAGGGFVDAVLTVEPGEVITLEVPSGGGAAGGPGDPGAAGVSAAICAGGFGGTGSERSGGGGGAAAGIIRNLAVVLCAPGGGGGSGEAAGGAGGGATGTDGGDGGVRHGNGGTSGAGGSGGSGVGGGAAGSAGTSAEGGDGGTGSTSGGGGGGGGRRGGGGGGAGSTAGAGGGGAALATGGTSAGGSGVTPGGDDDEDYAAGTGVGGDDGSGGGDGRIVLLWAPDPDTATEATAAGLLETVLRDRLGFRHVEAGADILVSIAADAATRTFTAGGGSFAGLGIAAGDQVSFAGLSENAGTNFTAATVGTTTLVVKEAVVDMAAETEFTLAVGDLDAPALAALATAAPQRLGAWLGEESPQGRDLVDRINATVGAWIDTDPAGLITVGRYTGPAAVADHDLDQRHLTAVRRVPVGAALWRRRIGARRCWRVHGPAEIAAAAPDAVRRFLLTEWREGLAEDTDVETDDLGAEEAFVEGLFDRKEDADAEAARQLALLSPAALAFEVEASLVALAWRPGQTVALTAAEVGLTTPRRLVIVAKEIRMAADAVTLTLLG